jgi:hypothetical protein
MRPPHARTHKLTVRELPDETLIFDHLANKAHCLNRTAALVWKHCNGRTNIRQLAAMLQRELGAPAADPLVHLALEKLAKRGLLDAAPATVRQGRRDLLRKLAVAALPVIMTITAPRAAQAASQAGPPPPSFCSSHADFTPCGTAGMQCCSGTCVTPAGALASCTSNCSCSGGRTCTHNPSCPGGIGGSMCCVAL